MSVASLSNLTKMRICSEVQVVGAPQALAALMPNLTALGSNAAFWPDAEPLSSLAHLQKLNLTDSPHFEAKESLTRAIQGLPALTELRLKYFRMADLGVSPAVHKNLACLRLRDMTGLLHMPSWSWQLTSLTSLILTRCPDGIDMAEFVAPHGRASTGQGLTSLRNLHIGGPLPTFPNPILSLTGLTRLALHISYANPGFNKLPDGITAPAHFAVAGQQESHCAWSWPR